MILPNTVHVPKPLFFSEALLQNWCCVWFYRVKMYSFWGWGWNLILLCTVSTCRLESPFWEYTSKLLSRSHAARWNWYSAVGNKNLCEVIITFADIEDVHWVKLLWH